MARPPFNTYTDTFTADSYSEWDPDDPLRNIPLTSLPELRRKTAAMCKDDGFISGAAQALRRYYKEPKITLGARRAMMLITPKLYPEVRYLVIQQLLEYLGKEIGDIPDFESVKNHCLISLPKDNTSEYNAATIRAEAASWE